MLLIQKWEKLNDDKGVCFDRSDNFCNFNSKKDKTVFLIGDSHMEVLSYNLLKKLFCTTYFLLSLYPWLLKEVAVMQKLKLMVKFQKL